MKYILVGIIAFALIVFMVLNNGEDEWIKNMPKGYMVVGRSFSSELKKEEIGKIASEYFEENKVYDFRVYSFNRGKNMFSIDYMTKEGDNRELLEPFLSLLNKK